MGRKNPVGALDADHAQRVEQLRAALLREVLDDRMDPEHVRLTLRRYLTVFPADHSRVEQLVRALADTKRAPISRDLPGHITTSGAVVDLERRAVLQVLHRGLDLWLLPGGHVETVDPSLPESAHRELIEVRPQ